MRKLSKRHIALNRLSKRADLDRRQVIKKMKEVAKNDPAIIAKFKKYDVPIDEIDDIHIEFCDLDVSAKTKDKKIYLNSKMLDGEMNSDIKDPTHYLIHELVHYLQQKTGKNTGKDHNTKDYLDKPSEEEAFETQVDYQQREESPEKANQYVNKLLDFHDIKGKEREDKKEELLN